MITLETQEAGTGKWFAVVQYVPGTEAQQEQARRLAGTLNALGLYASVCGAPVTATPEGPTR